jgi:hypothetical protein
MTAVREHGTPLVDDPARLDGVAALGVDETAFLAANAMHPTIFVTGMVDLTARQLLDVVPGRSAKALHDWVSGHSEQWRAGVTVAALDPFRGYAVRHEALVIRVWCKDPPPVCRSRPVKPRAAGPVEVRWSGGKQPCQSRDGSGSPDDPGPASEADRYNVSEPVVEPPQALEPARTWWIWAGQQRTPSRSGVMVTPKPGSVAGGEAHGECLRRTRGEAAGE